MTVPVLDAAVGDPPRRYMAGEQLPAVLTLRDLEAVLGLSATRIWRLYEGHELDFALLQPVVGNKPRFSGRCLQAWIDKQPTPAPVPPLETALAPAHRAYFGRRKRR